MAFVLAETGAVIMLRDLKGQGDIYWTGRLYVNNRVPAITDVIGDYTPATAISPITGWTNLWSGVSGDGTGKAFTSIDEVVFTQTSNVTQTCYGYYVYDTTPELVVAQRFESPVSLTLAGQQVKIHGLKYQLFS